MKRFLLQLHEQMQYRLFCHSFCEGGCYDTPIVQGLWRRIYYNF
jgi:hypothetical protein